MSTVDTLTKQKLCRRVARHTGYSTRIVTTIIEQLLDEVEEQLSSGGRLEIQNLLVLEVVKRTSQPPNHDQATLSMRSTLKAKSGKRLRLRLKALK